MRRLRRSWQFSLGPAEGEMGGPARQQGNDDRDDAVGSGMAMGEFEYIGTDPDFGNYQRSRLRAGNLAVADQQDFHQVTARRHIGGKMEIDTEQPVAQEYHLA